MTPEERLRQKIGEFVMTIAFLEHQLAERDATIANLVAEIAGHVPEVVGAAV